MLIGLAFGFSLATQSLVLPDRGAQIVPVEYVLPAQRVTAYPPEPNLQMTYQVILSPEARAAFDSEFADGGYFGAFATSKDGGWGYAMESNSLEAAREIAIAQCASINTTRCAVIAETFTRTRRGATQGADQRVAVGGGVRGVAAGECVPSAYWRMCISTRRFWARAVMVPLGTRGRSGPKPWAERRAAAMPCSMR